MRLAVEALSEGIVGTLVETTGRTTAQVGKEMERFCC